MPMGATVHIKKSALDYFRSLARNSPFEVQAYLIGEVRSHNHFHVTSLVHPREYAMQTKECVQPSGEDYDRAKHQAYLEAKRILGDIHSHPEWDAVMSPPDYEACVTDGLQVCGIVSVRGRKTKVRFWLANSALPCEISYD